MCGIDNFHDSLGCTPYMHRSCSAHVFISNCPSPTHVCLDRGAHLSRLGRAQTNRDRSIGLETLATEAVIIGPLGLEKGMPTTKALNMNSHLEARSSRTEFLFPFHRMLSNDPCGMASGCFCPQAIWLAKAIATINASQQASWRIWCRT